MNQSRSKNTLDCNDIVFLLPELSGKMLDDMDREKVLRHLENCAECREEYAKIEGFLEHIPVKTEEELAPPADFFPDMWQNLYSRIQVEGLNRKHNRINSILQYISFLFSRKTYQVLTGAAIVVLCVSMYYSMQSDRYTPQKSLLSEFISGLGIENTMGDFTVDLDNRKKQLSNVLSFGIGSAEKPIQEWGAILSSERRQNFYETLTDYLADAVIKLDKGEYNE